MLKRQTNSPQRKISAGNLVEATGFAPLAARPGAQHTVLCGLLSRFPLPAPIRKLLTPVRTSTLKSRRLDQKTGRENPARFL